MKNIFVLLDSGFPIRNLLRNEFWKRLVAEKNNRIVLFSPVVDPYFHEEFGADNVVIKKAVKWKPNVIIRWLRSVKRLAWSVSAKSHSFDLKLALKKGFFYKGFIFVARLLPENFWINITNSINEIERKFLPREAKELFDTYQPEVVFLTTIFSRNPALELEGFNRKIKTIAFVQSWDNPTTKGPMPFTPDLIAVWNKTIKTEMMNYHGIEESRINVVGVPQFDHYINEDKLQSIDEFMDENNLTPERRILCYTTGTPWTCPYDTELIEVVYELVATNAFCEPCQLIVRTHPNDDRDYSRFKNRKYLTFHSLGDVKNPIDNWGPSVKDMYRFASLMKRSDIVVNVASTTTIDSASFDTPIVNIAFDGKKNKEYIRSNRRYYKYCHYENIVKTGGVSVCYDVGSFIESVNNYLQNAELLSAGRQEIVDGQCWRLDGKSGTRLAEIVLDEIC